jgi:hypothetical protein
MKFMVMMKSDKEMEEGVLPTEEQLSEFIRFNGELVHSGVLLAGEGLLPSAQGARLNHGGAGKVTDGPFAETKELVAGFWVITASSLAEAIERMRNMPEVYGKKPVLEFRQCVEPADYGDVMTPELRERDERERRESARLAVHED